MLSLFGKGPEKRNAEFGQYYTRAQTLPEPERISGFLQPIPKGGRLLDFGCGTGNFSAAFHRDRPDLTIDVLDKNLDDANFIKDQSWVGKRMHQDGRTFKAHDTYDAIFARAVLSYIPYDEQVGVLQNLGNALKKDGMLMFTFIGRAPEDKEIDTFHRDEEEIRQMAEQAGLKIDNLVAKDLPFGPQHKLLPNFYIYASKA